MKFKNAPFLFALVAISCSTWLLVGQSGSNYAEYEIHVVTTSTSSSVDPAKGTITVSRIFFGQGDGSKGT
ncbi:MAG: hypothetical protein IT162_10210 [Bryobacterales bacterium]|nr:hypothetical protein [Bryobacterales bacterium]